MSACKKCIKQQQKRSYHTLPNRKISNKKYQNSSRGKETRRRYIQTNGYKFNRWKYWLRGKYGLTPEQYDQILIDQNGCCKICKLPETANNQYGLMRLAVDHNHMTGNTRGLLCQRCNQAIGLMNENVKILKETIRYILKNETT